MRDVAPFRLKWAGGKRWLATELARGLGSHAFQNGLCEPFAGGAALSFAANPSWSHLGDSNSDLIATYRAIKECPDQIAGRLKRLTIDRKTFEMIRDARPSDGIERAVRVIYLNRTAFGGLWRVNAKGDFNVPFGCKPETRLPTHDELLATSRVCATYSFQRGDFAEVAAEIKAQTIYFDPPYTVAHNNNGFVRYNERIFSWTDQCRLAELARTLVGDGRTVLVSNAFHSDIQTLYRGGPFRIYRVSRNANLAASPLARGVAEELLIVSSNIRFRSLPGQATRVS